MGNVLVLVENSKFVGVVYNILKGSIKHDVTSLNLGTKNAAIRTEKDNYFIEINGGSVRKEYFDKVIDFTFDGLMSKIIEDRIENEFDNYTWTNANKEVSEFIADKFNESIKSIKEAGSTIGDTLKSCGTIISGGNINIEDSEDGKIYFKVDGKVVGYVGKWEIYNAPPEHLTININMCGTDVTQVESFATKFVEQLKKKGGKLI